MLVPRLQQCNSFNSQLIDCLKQDNEEVTK